MWQAPHKEEQRSQGPKRPADTRRFRFDGALGFVLVAVGLAVLSFILATLGAYAVGHYVVAPSFYAHDRAYYRHHLDEQIALFDVRDIRLAMTGVAGEDPICCGDGTADLREWSQLRGVLNHTLREAVVADGGSTTTLASANPWGGAYAFAVDPSSPSTFELRITITNPTRTPVTTRRFLGLLGHGALTRPRYEKNGQLEEIRVVYPL